MIQKHSNVMLSMRELILKKLPTFQGILTWTLLSSLIALCVGASSALFLASLHWATDFREAHKLIILTSTPCGLINWFVFLLVGQGH